MKKRLLCVLVAAALLLGILTSCGGSADESPGPEGSATLAASNSPEPFSGPTGEVLDSGEAGENVTWSFYSDGTLVISGTGPMEDYELGYSIVDSIMGIEHRGDILKIVIEDGVTSIGISSFPSYRSLTDVIIPDSVTSIGNSAFPYCSSLTDVTIPDSVTSIGERAFEGCSSLTSVTIGNSVTSIGTMTFEGCSSLTDVYYGGSEGQWNQISVSSHNDELFNATIHYNS